MGGACPPCPGFAGTSAAKAADGSLVAAFTAELPQPPEALLAAPFPFVYAIGPLGPDGGLLPHTSGGKPYGGAQLTLRGGGGGGGADPAPEPVPAATDSGTEPAQPPPPPQPAAAATPAAPALEGSADPSGCQLAVGGRQLSFAACTPIQGIGKDFQLMWRLEPASGEAHSAYLCLFVFPARLPQSLQCTCSVWCAGNQPGTGHALGHLW